jgi:hypothetical protein
MSALTFHAGPRALAQIRAHGLRAQDIATIPAAAGGPKGLIFQSLDQWLFGEWLPSSPRERTLIGSSIGAWRMAAACQRDPVKGFARLGELYSGQRYASASPGQDEIDRVVQDLLREFVSGHEQDIVNHPHHRLHLITVRGKGSLASARHPRAQKFGFAAAALHNLASRERLGRVLERVVIGDKRAGAMAARALRQFHYALFGADGAEPGNGPACLGHAAAHHETGQRHCRSPARLLLGRRHHRLPPRAAVLARRRHRAVSAFQ